MGKVIEGNKYFTFLVNNSVILLFICLVASETYFKISLFSGQGTSILLQVIKGSVLGLFSLALFIKTPNKLLGVGFLFLFFCFTYYDVCLEQKAILIHFVKLIYPIIFFIFFSTFKLKSTQRVLLFNVFEYVMLFNTLLVLLGFIFNISVFKSYLGGRFGYNGIFVSSAVSTYVYSLTMIFLLIRYKKNLFRRYINMLILLPIFLVGTKSLYLFSFFLIALYIWRYSLVKKQIIIVFFILTFIIVFYIFFFQISIFNNIRESQGLFTSIMSYRDKLFLEKTLPFIKDNWEFKNFLFGGVTDLSTKSQMDFIDVFYFLGIIGGGLYLYLYYKSFFTFKTNLEVKLLLSLLLVIVFVAGNFFAYPSIVIYLFILKELLIHDNERNQEYLNKND